MSSDFFSFPAYAGLFHDMANHMFTSPVVVAVSGGPDSMFVAYLLYAYWKRNNISLDTLHIVHCNHHTRPETDHEEQLVRTTFSELPVHISHYMEEKKKESDLRARRYRCFRAVMEITGSTILITGHHLNDRVETTFLHMLRGCGIDGFLAMRNWQTHPLLPHSYVYRPLLQTSKAYIQQQCDHRNIPYALDSSNNDATISKRNTLRQTVFPLLTELSHKKDTTSTSFLESMQHVYTSYEQAIPPLHIENICTSIFLPSAWNAQRGYRCTFPRADLTTTHLHDMLAYFGVLPDISATTYKKRASFLQETNHGYIRYKQVYLIIAHAQLYIIHAPIRFWTRQDYSEIDTQDIPAQRANYTIRFSETSDRYKGKTRNKRCINHKIPFFYRNYVPLVVDEKNSIVAALTHLL